MRLLDVNALVALVLEQHEHHVAMIKWMRDHPKQLLGTCSLTQTSLLRLLMNPAVNEYPVDMETGLALLQRLHDHPRHLFLTEMGSPLTSEISPHLRRVLGFRQVTDAYLIAIARANGGKLVTFDRKLAAVFPSEDLELIERT